MLWLNMIPLCVWFLMQKNILVHYGLRRITFLISQEVSPILSVSVRLLPSPDSVPFPGHSGCSWGWRGPIAGEDSVPKDAFYKQMGLSLETSVHVFKWVLLDLIVSVWIFFFAERISQVFHIQSKR